jgi:hypothetical protein
MRRCNQPKHLNATRVLFEFISIWDLMQTLMLHKLFWVLSHINITLCIIWYHWTTKFILEIPQFNICKNKLKLVLEIAKQKIGNIRKRNEAEKKREVTYLAAAHLAEAKAGPTPSPAVQPNLPLRSSSTSSWEAARWSSCRHPIRHRLLDTRDEGRRPSSSIKPKPPLWISPRISIPSPSPSFLAGTETLASAEPLAVARDHPERRRVAPELRIGKLGILVEEIELEWAQSKVIHRAFLSLAGAHRWACRRFRPCLASPSITSHSRWASDSPEPPFNLHISSVSLLIVDRRRPSLGHVARVAPVTNRSPHHHQKVPHRPLIPVHTLIRPLDPSSIVTIVDSTPTMRSRAGQLFWLGQLRMAADVDFGPTGQPLWVDSDQVQLVLVLSVQIPENCWNLENS